MNCVKYEGNLPKFIFHTLYFLERSTKTRSGAKSGDYRRVTPKMFSQPDNGNCPVEMYKTYVNHMPDDVKTNPNARFYLRPLQNPKSSVWYSHLPLGRNTIGKMMRAMANLGELEGRKTNHSTRKTFATTLLDADIPNTEVAQLGGWKSIQTLTDYSAPNIKKTEKCF